MTLPKASKAANRSRSTEELDVMKTFSSCSFSDKHRSAKTERGESDRRELKTMTR